MIGFMATFGKLVLKFKVGNNSLWAEKISGDSNCFSPNHFAHLSLTLVPVSSLLFSFYLLFISSYGSTRIYVLLLYFSGLAN